MAITERREREKAARRTTIMNAAETVFFRNGVDGAKMDDIAKEAELSKGLLYFYFRSKHDLAHAIVHRGLGVLEQLFAEVLATHELGVEQLHGMGLAYIRFSREYRDYFHLMSWAQALPAESWEPGSFGEQCEMEGEACIEKVAQAVRNGIADGTVRPDLDPIETAIALWGQTHGLIQIAAFRETQDRYAIEPNRLMNRAMGLMSFGFASEMARADRAAQAHADGAV